MYVVVIAGTNCTATSSTSLISWEGIFSPTSQAPRFDPVVRAVDRAVGAAGAAGAGSAAVDFAEHLDIILADAQAAADILASC